MYSRKLSTAAPVNILTPYSRQNRGALFNILKGGERVEPDNKKSLTSFEEVSIPRERVSFKIENIWAEVLTDFKSYRERLIKSTGYFSVQRNIDDYKDATKKRLRLDEYKKYTSLHIPKEIKLDFVSEIDFDIQSFHDLKAAYVLIEVKFLSDVAVRLVHQKVSLATLKLMRNQSTYLAEKLHAGSYMLEAIMNFGQSAKYEESGSRISIRLESAYQDIKLLTSRIEDYSNIFESNVSIQAQVQKLQRDANNNRINDVYIQGALAEIKKKANIVMTNSLRLLNSDARGQDKSGILTKIDVIYQKLDELVKNINKIIRPPIAGPTAIA